VELDLERHLHVADISVRGKDFDIKSTAQNKELTTAIHEAIEKLDIQARRAKTRLKGRKRHGDEIKASAEWTEDILEPASDGAGEPRIVAHETIPVKPMSIDEAMMQLEETKDDFIVFLNASNERVNVLYRRRDKNMGLITPEI
jgi:putative sigma-54 modulation protein